MVDECGRPRVLQLSPGNINDISMAEALIQAAGPFRRLLADKGYDADHLRKLLAERGAEAVIPSTAARRTPIPYDKSAYRERNRVERMWCRLKDFRRVAPATTNSPETISPASSSLHHAHTGSIESRP